VLGSVLLVPAIWMGRNVVNQQVDTVATNVAAPLLQANETVARLVGFQARGAGRLVLTGGLERRSDSTPELKNKIRVCGLVCTRRTADQEGCRDALARSDETSGTHQAEPAPRRVAPPKLEPESGTRKSFVPLSASRSNVLYLSLIWLPPGRTASECPVGPTEESMV